MKEQFALGRRGVKEEFLMTEWQWRGPETATPPGCAGLGKTLGPNKMFTSKLADIAQCQLVWVSLWQKKIAMVTRTQFSITY